MDIIRRIKKIFKVDNEYFAPLFVRPFQLEDLQSVPMEWKVGPPDFVGISSPKAGTSWWYSLILDHPEVENNRLNKKELSYFFHFGLEDTDTSAISIYRQAFAAPIGSISGEWSPSYLWFPLALENLFKAVPETKIIILLRNPIDRYLSHFNDAVITNNLVLGYKPELCDITRKFWIYPDSILQGMISVRLSKLLSLFNRDQILMLQYEKCKKNTYEEISRTYRFLEIDDTYIPKEHNKPVNKKKYIFDTLSLEQRKILADYYRDDVEQIVQMFPEIDLTLWADF